MASTSKPTKRRAAASNQQSVAKRIALEEETVAVQFVGEDEVYPIQCGELLAMDDEMPFGDYCELYLGMLVLAPYIQQDGTVAHHPAKLTSLDAKGCNEVQKRGKKKKTKKKSPKSTPTKKEKVTKLANVKKIRNETMLEVSNDLLKSLDQKQREKPDVKRPLVATVTPVTTDPNPEDPTVAAGIVPEENPLVATDPNPEDNPTVSASIVPEETPLVAPDPEDNPLVVASIDPGGNEAVEISNTPFVSPVQRSRSFERSPSVSSPCYGFSYNMNSGFFDAGEHRRTTDSELESLSSRSSFKSEDSYVMQQTMSEVMRTYVLPLREQLERMEKKFDEYLSVKSRKREKHTGRGRSKSMPLARDPFSPIPPPFPPPFPPFPPQFTPSVHPQFPPPFSPQVPPPPFSPPYIKSEVNAPVRSVCGPAVTSSPGSSSLSFQPSGSTVYLGYPDAPDYRVEAAVDLQEIEKNCSTPLALGKELFKTLYKEELESPQHVCCTKTLDSSVRLLDQGLLHGIRLHVHYRFPDEKFDSPQEKARWEAIVKKFNEHIRNERKKKKKK